MIEALIFSTKNIGIFFSDINVSNFNEMLTNDVSYEQPGPRLQF